MLEVIAGLKIYSSPKVTISAEIEGETETEGDRDELGDILNNIKPKTPISG